MKNLLLLSVAVLLLNGCNSDDRLSISECSITVQRGFFANMPQSDQVCSELGDTPYTSILWFKFMYPDWFIRSIPREQCPRKITLSYPQLSFESVSILCSPRP